jgi:hypothetical protein
MPFPRIPQKQLDAFPIITQDDVAGVDVTVVGSQVTKHWGPTQLGINGTLGNVQDPDLAGGANHKIMTSNFIDVSGCNTFSLVLRVTYNAGADWPGGGGDAWLVYMQYRNPAHTVLPRTGDLGGTQSAQCGQVIFGANPGVDVFPLTMACSLGWSNAAPWTSGSAKNTGVGNDVRLWFSKGNAGATAGQSYIADLWGTT